MADGIAVIVGNGCLQAVNPVQPFTVITDAQIGAAACLARHHKGNGLLFRKSDVIS